MRISHEHKFVYFSIPKTASSSIRHFLEPYSDVDIVGYPQTSQEKPFHIHMRPAEARDALLSQQFNPDTYFTFATVRNPWARVASLYAMLQRNKGAWRYGSFKNWLGTIRPDDCESSSGTPKWHAYGVLSYRSFLSTPPGGKKVDRVYRIEDGFEELINDLKLRVGQDLWTHDFPLINANPRRTNYGAVYDRQTIKMVESLYEDDIQSYNYSFNA